MSHFYRLSEFHVVCANTGALYTYSADSGKLYVFYGSADGYLLPGDVQGFWQRLLDLCAVSEKQLEYEMLPGLIVDTETLHEQIDRLQPIPGGASVIKTGE